AGINNAQIGNLVGPQSGPLAIVSTVDPILVSFTLSEAEYFDVERRIAASGKTEEAALGTLKFTLQLADGSKYPHLGRVHAVDRQVDVKTGSILIQTEFLNPGNVLRPGGFGRISTVAGVERGALLVPQRSILEVQGTHFAGVVGPDNTVKLRSVDLGATIGAMRIVSKGLQAGDAVIVEGIQKIRDGMQVIPKTSALNQRRAAR
ncbi:MAG: efflux RND transporter periplasmic adaptor subunit, partial [Acidobacteriaceae bacterium]|nr:efflux RND transporter periplasmic adaptor subunit [Acidobacteriaceae bacterium]